MQGDEAPSRHVPRGLGVVGGEVLCRYQAVAAAVDHQDHAARGLRRAGGERREGRHPVEPADHGDLLAAGQTAVGNDDAAGEGMLGGVGHVSNPPRQRW